MRNFSGVMLLLFICNCFLLGQDSKGLELSGELKKWHKVTLTLEGPLASETGEENPFLDYRLEVIFSKGDKSYKVPGYFAADGAAGETSADQGTKWRVHFSPDEEGIWNYEISFRKGKNIAVSQDEGKVAFFQDGAKGNFKIGPSDKSGRDLRAKGRLQFVGKPYLQFAETGEYFIKVGADAPENLLAYKDFDGDFKTDGHKDELVKEYKEHVQDWQEGDPEWQDGKGKGLIGAINYISDKGLNAFSFLTFNIEGDDQNAFPYVSYDDFTRIDVSRMDQWEKVFEHADAKGMFLHFKTSEVENQCLLDGGELGLERKLYYRELIARFSHHLALNWNIGEENGKWNLPKWNKPWQTTTQRLACAQYFYDHDPYRHHVVIHNGQEFYDILGPEAKYTGLSLQTNKADFSNVHNFVLKWRNLAADAGKVWALAVDEPGDHRYSLVPDAINPEHDNARQNALWGALMAGAWGIEWYFGYENEHSDLTCEDWRSRDKMWDQSRYAARFFTDYNVPFWEMTPSDDLTSNENDYVLADPGNSYVVFLKMGDKVSTKIKGLKEDAEVKWYNPRTGMMQDGSKLVSNGEIGMPPAESEMDWVALIKVKK